MTEEDRELLRDFVGTFELLGDLTVTGEVDRADGAHAGKESLSGLTPLVRPPAHPDDWREWRPIAANLPHGELQQFYRNIPGPLSALYENLILSFYWAEVDLGRLRLLANLPPGLRGLAGEITKDGILFDTLAPAGFVQFAKGPDYDYDPICFDLSSRDGRGDCRIVKFDHEEIFRSRRVGAAQELAPSFRALVELVIEDARRTPPKGQG